MTTSLDGRIALVTGAGRGIGQAIALQLAGAGVSVALVARSRHELEETAFRVKEFGATALVVPADLGDLSEVTRIAQLASDKLGKVGVLVNNAAVVWPIGPSVAVDPNQWATAVDVNVVAAAVLSFALLPAMLDQGWGRIVNVSSAIAAHPGAMTGMNAYAASKAALEAHTINLATELAGSGVTVNAFRPGSVDTAMQRWIRGQEPERIGAELHAWFTRSYAEGSMITPEQSARSLLPHLSSDETGAIWDASDLPT
jgi:NAD(P)-dependent dehydrogenase (short-subunit alcohol dehydrogenase family)